MGITMSTQHGTKFGCGLVLLDNNTMGRTVLKHHLGQVNGGTSLCTILGILY